MTAQQTQLLAKLKREYTYLTFAINREKGYFRYNKDLVDRKTEVRNEIVYLEGLLHERKSPLSELELIGEEVNQGHYAN